MNTKVQAALKLSVLTFYSIFISHVSAAPVVATPGTLAGYTYFPKESQSSGGSSSSGEEIDSLQRCLWSPSVGDKTVTVTDTYGYGKAIKIYYRMVGGNGGGNVNGGGGGASAILLNGAVAVVANGGNAGQVATEKSGVLMAKGGDVLRFVTGGGGGAGVWGGTFSIGGGGGAGYMGGGAGASHNGANMTALATYAGKGGSTTGGAGGYGTGMWAGTSGGLITGGVATFLNGSTVPTGSFGGGYANYTDWNYGYSSIIAPPLRYAAGTQQGSPMGDATNFTWLGGSGGALGNSGGGAVDTTNTTGSFGGSNYWRQQMNCRWGCQAHKIGSTMSTYPPHTEKMQLTRQIVWNSDNGSVEAPWNTALGGQIITMYQAPVCEFLP